MTSRRAARGVRPTGPWSCRRCHRLVSTRGNHHATRDCTPHRPDVRHDPPRMTPPHWGWPYRGWPPSHLHHDETGRRYLTSPVPTLGPWLFDALLHHTAHADGGNAMAGMRAVLTDPQAALAGSRTRPARLAVACGDDHHVLIWVDGRTATPDHPGDLCEDIAAVLTGAPNACRTLTRAWPTPTAWHAYRPYWQRLRAADAWIRVGADLPDVDPFLRWAYHPDDLTAAAAGHNVTPDELLRWAPLTRTPAEIAAWLAVGCTVQEALNTPPLHVAAETAAWRARGLDTRRVHEAHQAGLPLDEAADWYDAGCPLDQVRHLQHNGITLTRYQALRARTPSHRSALRLAATGTR